MSQILTLSSDCCTWNWDSSDQVTFFESCVVQFWQSCANYSLNFLHQCALLHSLVVTSQRLEAFLSPRELLLTGCFLFSWSFSACGKVQIDQKFLKYSKKIKFLPHSDAWRLTEASFDRSFMRISSAQFKAHRLHKHNLCFTNEWAWITPVHISSFPSIT